MRALLITHNMNTAQAQAQKTYHQATLRSLKQTHKHTASERAREIHAYTLAYSTTRTYTRRHRETDTKHSKRWNPVRLVRFVTKNNFLLSPAFGCCAHRSYGKTVDSVIHTFECARCIVRAFAIFPNQRAVLHDLFSENK